MKIDEQKLTIRQATLVKYPANLPVSGQIDHIRQLVLNNQVVIVCGETGSGKTTQLPKLLFELGFADKGIIGHTQPRKIAAKTVAKRIAEELNNHDIVGYKVRFIDKIKQQTCIKLMTDGILLQEIQTDKKLRKYSALIIDEAHERSLNIDFILGYLKTILSKRTDLKIIITSATIDNVKLSKFYNNAPIVMVEGKTYPVDIIYQPLDAVDKEIININQAVYAAINACFSIELGSVLVFLPGEREIRECIHFLKKSSLRNHLILPLFARQNETDQNKVLSSDGALKIILTTNVAETSLTIPGIRFVIDSGLARIKRYNTRNKVEQLQVESISKASSKQRLGRAGRVSHGMCIRLFSEDEFNLRPEFSDPEILRSNLANVILKLTSFHLGKIEDFPFMDKPDNRAFNDGFKTLVQLQALDTHNRITPLGRKLSQIPLDCNLARMLVAAHDLACLTEILIIVTYLAIINPREYIAEFQQLTRTRHQLWEDKQSDFIAILNLWHWYHHEVLHNSKAKLLEKCRYQFVSLLRLRDWHELHGQLKEIVHNLGMVENKEPASYAQIHQAVLSGLLNNIGQKDLVENFYHGTNSKKIFIHPSSFIDKPKWMVSANLMQTTRLYARDNGYIEPIWVLPFISHLVKHTYANEHWEKKRGEVVASRSSLFGGLILEKKLVGLGQINQSLARELFIKQGLVTGELTTQYSWLLHNQNVIKNIEKLEDKLRLSLLMIEDELFEFYNNVLPEDVYDIPSLESWIKNNRADQCGTSSNAEYLKLNQEQFIAKFTSQLASVGLYPNFIIVGSEKIRLKYKFNPGSPDDGMNAIIYLNQLNRLNPAVFSYLVPGLLRDKVTFILKALPKAIRMVVNPINEFVTRFLEQVTNYEIDIALVLAQYISQEKGSVITHHMINQIKLPPHLICHFQIMDQKEIIAGSDDLIELKSSLSSRINQMVSVLRHEHEMLDIKGWVDQLTTVFNEVKLKRQNHEIVAYISLIVKNDQVNLAVVDELSSAQKNSQKGLFRLVKYQLSEQIKYLEHKKFTNFKQIGIYFADIYTLDKLFKDSINQVLKMSIDLTSFPRTEMEFLKLCSVSKNCFGENSLLLANVLHDTAKLYHQVKLKIKDHPLQPQIILQLDDLLYPDFLCYIDFLLLENYPRYLQAILIRLDKYMLNKERDQKLQTEVDELYEAWYNYVDGLENKGRIIAKAVYDFKYKVEELRISLFAVELKTRYKVSAKRLWQELEAFPEYI
ncbi:MAG: ATP-dependent RNA helicase HrpA [Burkholderiales bacterium]|nr:ATP-dependent RNA helicase HrpA [Burkholderiales bacterium]